MPDLSVDAASGSGLSRQDATCFRVKFGNTPNAALGTSRDTPSMAGLVCLSPSSCLDATEVTPTEMEFNAKVSLVNALSVAYKSSGYPTVASTNSPHMSIYGAFVELRNPSLYSLTLPPDETLVVDLPTPRSRNNAMNASAAIPSCASIGISDACRPLLRVKWKRSSHLFHAHAATTTATAATAASSLSPNLFSLPSPKTLPCSLPPRGIPAASLKHLQQFPDGIHDVQTSSRMSELLLGSPQTVLTASSASRAKSVPAGVAPSTTGTNPQDEEQKTAINTLVEPSPPSSPLEDPPVEGTPVQLTLVTASSFNQLTTYAVRHQGGNLLEVVPLQTLVASLTPRRITAHCPFLLCTTVGETYMDMEPGFPTDREQETLRKGGQKQSNRSFTFYKPAIPMRQGAKKGVGLSFERGQAERAMKKEMNAAMGVTTQCIAVEPFILIGNQGGDLLLFSMLEGKVVQRLNFSGGVSGGDSGDSARVTPKQVVSGLVTCITEVECGLEKCLDLTIERAGLSRKRSSLTAPFASKEGCGCLASVFAVGFISGHVLLVCVTLEGAWLSKLISLFGQRPVQAMAMQVPHFLKRLWLEDTAAPSSVWASPPARQKGSFPASVTCVAAETLLVDEDSGMVAVSCDGGILRLVKALDMESEVGHITALENHSVGCFLAVQWVPSHADAALHPDLLVVTNEDDSITVYHLSHISGGNKTSSSLPTRASNPFLMEDTEAQSPLLQPQSFSAPSRAVRDGVVLVARRCFHRSWVNDLCALPLPERGHLLVATSYDGCSSFWPLCCAGAAPSAEGLAPTPLLGLEPFIQERFSGCVSQDASGVCAPLQRSDDFISDEPSYAVMLHSGQTIRCIACGAGRNEFLVSLCLRGRVRFWEVKRVLNQV
ncbi:hypothetical protein TraAM80_05285 [Trypanosoma rangeli]|uniref:Uncharacterized protein n=1 Tax=Trypanosoma rangeli TaxID=5698 RepID=A0A3S5IR38_TRYRA|nr:uncharacterized protein TraAM80_05285 [Trypanosoma rangeli]RNF04181.1 hypothetical protein TraAM80_05285 [Trypanosoma rangeli]|eukprot:RNF04181.1 hypothetical protein TraAM80_05285 [Trypanosoma rangeli]